MASNVPAHLLAMIRERVETRRVQVGDHAVTHGFAEGFRIRDVLTAARTGIIIEHYPDRGRCLMCARVRVGSGRLLWLHVVCDYNHPVVLDITTAYVPDPAEWEHPPVRRR